MLKTDFAVSITIFLLRDLRIMGYILHIFHFVGSKCGLQVTIALRLVIFKIPVFTISKFS
jgi:hypothetical protein